MEILIILALAVLAGWLLAHLNVWIFRRKQSRILRQWAARCPSVEANSSPKSYRFHGATCTLRIAEAEDELERARR
jgi:hypothetical protein